MSMLENPGKFWKNHGKIGEFDSGNPVGTLNLFVAQNLLHQELLALKELWELPEPWELQEQWEVWELLEVLPTLIVDSPRPRVKRVGLLCPLMCSLETSLHYCNMLAGWGQH